jgi:signal transduction histidine kinase
VRVRFEAPERAPVLGDEAEVALFRALQEALSNVARHAAATSVAITLGLRERGITMRVIDDGHGMRGGSEAARTTGGMGLAGMGERIASLGGALTVREPARGGVELTLELPVNAADD